MSSRETGLLYEFNLPGYENSDGESLKRIAERIYENWSWQWKLDVEDDWTKAELLLNAELSRAKL